MRRGVDELTLGSILFTRGRVKKRKKEKKRGRVKEEKKKKKKKKKKEWAVNERRTPRERERRLG